MHQTKFNVNHLIKSWNDGLGKRSSMIKRTVRPYVVVFLAAVFLWIDMCQIAQLNATTRGDSSKDSSTAPEYEKLTPIRTLVKVRLDRFVRG